MREAVACSVKCDATEKQEVLGIASNRIFVRARELSLFSSSRLFSRVDVKFNGAKTTKT